MLRFRDREYYLNVSHPLQLHRPNSLDNCVPFRRSGLGTNMDTESLLIFYKQLRKLHHVVFVHIVGENAEVLQAGHQPESHACLVNQSQIGIDLHDSNAGKLHYFVQKLLVDHFLLFQFYREQIMLLKLMKLREQFINFCCIEAVNEKHRSISGTCNLN